MNSFLKSAVMAAVIASVSGMAQADSFSLNGTFDTTSFTGPLNGGSYTGTYDFTNGAVTSFSISLLNSSGTVLGQINSANGGLTGMGTNPNDSSLTTVYFASDSSLTNLLNLNFTSPFTGAGAVQLGSGNYRSFAIVGGYSGENLSAVAGGMAVAVPEPATWGLMGLGLLGVAAVARRRKAA